MSFIWGFLQLLALIKILSFGTLTRPSFIILTLIFYSFLIISYLSIVPGQVTLAHINEDIIYLMSLLALILVDPNKVIFDLRKHLSLYKTALGVFSFLVLVSISIDVIAGQDYLKGSAYKVGAFSQAIIGLFYLNPQSTILKLGLIVPFIFFAKWLFFYYLIVIKSLMRFSLSGWIIAAGAVALVLFVAGILYGSLEGFFWARVVGIDTDTQQVIIKDGARLSIWAELLGEASLFQPYPNLGFRAYSLTGDPVHDHNMVAFFINRLGWVVGLIASLLVLWKLWSLFKDDNGAYNWLLAFNAGLVFMVSTMWGDPIYILFLLVTAVIWSGKVEIPNFTLR